MGNSWAAIAERASTFPPGMRECVQAHAIQRPSVADGFYQSIGWPAGQTADMRLRYADGTGLHVHVYQGRYCYHRDRVDFRSDPAGHAIQDLLPEIAGGLAGATLGFCIGGKGGALIGALLGLAVTGDRKP